MSEPTLIAFDFQELAEMLVRKQGIHEGLWGIYIRFGLGAANVGGPDGKTLPAALVPVREIGLQKFDEVSSLTVDAAKVNPAVKSTKKSKAKTKTATKSAKTKRKRT